MPAEKQFDARKEILRLLLERVASERHPSGATLNMIEGLLAAPDDKEMYARLLMDKIETSRYPSIDMLNRLMRQAA
jgi:hypothetical protein